MTKQITIGEIMNANNQLIAGLPDRYQVKRPIGQSTYATVYQAYNRDRDVEVALKILQAQGTQAGVAREMFRREVSALQGLKHPAIVQNFNSFECGDGLLVIELELIPGGKSLLDLFEQVRIEKVQRPSMQWRVQMDTALAAAVGEAHRRDVIHRDIKPGNVLWNKYDNELKLADFGIAAVLHLTVSDRSGMTLRSFYTRPFASPEQLLQQSVTPQSDVYGFGLLVASLLSLREPDENFEPAQLDTLLAGALTELAAEGVSNIEVEELSRVLMQTLLEDANQRPTLTAITHVLQRIEATLKPRPQAVITLTHTAIRKLEDAGFHVPAKMAEDFNTDLRVRVEHTDSEQTIRIKIFGHSLWAVLVPDEDCPETLLIVDAGQNPGPKHESHRRSAESCPIRLYLGRGSAQELLAFAHEADRQATRRANIQLVERARLILGIERERLPVFVVEAVVEGGQGIRGRREERIGQASGYVGSSTEKVKVNGGFCLKIDSVQEVGYSEYKNLVKEHLKRKGVQFDESGESCKPEPDSDWHTLFDDMKDIHVLNSKGRRVGKGTRYDSDSKELHVATDKPCALLRYDRFFVKNYQKERQLLQQEAAIETLVRGESARADMSNLLAEAAVHHMGDLPYVKLLQRLIPEHEVSDIVNRILASESIFCLQGPPGTGKTTIISEVVAQTLLREPRSRILVCSQANDAVANAIERILDLKTELNRDWIVERDVRPERARQEGAWAGHKAAYRQFSKRIENGTRQATGDTVADEAIREWVSCVKHGSDHVKGDYHGLVQVWGTTTACSPRPLRDLEGEHYDLVIIDEAAKATVGEVLVPIVRAKRLLLVGDQKQLPPFLENTTTQALQELGISEEDAQYSLFEHLFEMLPRDHRHKLAMQFRMHPSIGDVVSKLFYDDTIKNGPGKDKRPMPAGLFDRKHRVMWIDVKGKNYKVNTSWANDLEREEILKVLDRLDRDAQKAGQTLTVAIIAAYLAQANKLKDEIERRRWKKLKVKAATVNAFQGREADVVLYSLVRTGDGSREFIADGRRFNVALSRAKSLLIMIGDKAGSRNTARLQQLLEMIPEENQIEASELAQATAFGEKLAVAVGAKFHKTSEVRP